MYAQPRRSNHAQGSRRVENRRGVLEVWNSQSMNIVDRDAKVIWDYMLMHQELRPADAILVFGSNDTRVAERAADLYLQHYAPLIIFSGKSGKNSTLGRPEADMFAEIAIARGVPEDHILREDQATNTGENIALTRKLLAEKDLDLKTFIIVQKPYMERRTYATVKKQWPEIDFAVTSPQLSFEEYPDTAHHADKDRFISVMVGGLRRIKEYPTLGFQIPQDIPDEVWRACQDLEKAGYTKHALMQSCKKVHFVGIGGIGMSALAQMLAHDGAVVTGSDREESPVTEMLEEEGIHVVVGQAAGNVPTDAELVVYSDAVPADNPERAEAARRGIPQFSYFALLGEISAGKRTVAVAGTHGKTTTTGMLAKILVDAGAAPTAIIGSIVKDFESNYVAAKPSEAGSPGSPAGELRGTSDIFVVEACEYKDHLLELSPETLVITNLEWDHTDYFPSLAALQETFTKAVAKMGEHGAIVTDPANPNITPVLRGARARVIDYTKEPSHELLLPGEFNQQNARAAAAAARVVLNSPTPGVNASSPTPGVDEVIAAALAAFHGTWRRFEYKGKTAAGAQGDDDHAHQT